MLHFNAETAAQNQEQLVLTIVVMLAEYPVTLAQPRQWEYELRLHRSGLVPAYDPPELKLPDFEALAKNPSAGGDTQLSPRFVSGAFGGTIMRNKPLTLGAVAALLMAGGNAYAAVCPTSAPVMTIESSGFSCTLADKVFNSFFFDGVPTTATVSFGIKGSDFAVTLAKDGTVFTEPTLLFEYTVAITPPVTIVQATLRVDVSVPTVDTRTEMDGNNSLGGLRVMNGGTDMVTFSSGNNSIEVLNSSNPGPNSDLTSITNDFLQSRAGAAVPEPMSLSLFGVALAGLALARRRRA